MADNDKSDGVPSSDDDWVEEDELAGDVDEDVEDDLEVDLEDDELEDDAVADSATDDDEDDEALGELEAEELDMLTEDEAAEALPVDEAEELRRIRREALGLESTAESASDDEFVCSTCFLVKRRSQLADKRKKLCLDCI